MIQTEHLHLSRPANRVVGVFFGPFLWAGVEEGEEQRHFVRLRMQRPRLGTLWASDREGRSLQFSEIVVEQFHARLSALNRRIR